jgi:hypothetical protein
MLDRRSLLLALPLGAAACAGGSDGPAPLPPLVTGYRHLTPLRLNVGAIDIVPPAPDAVRVDQPAPLRPDAEARRMAEERLVAAGSAGQARFLTQQAEFLRARQAGTGGFFSGEAGERLTCRIRVRLEIVNAEGQRVGFVEAEARRERTTGSGGSAASRNVAAEEVVRQTMEALNVEFEFQIRRSLRGWLVETATPPPGSVEREDLPRS